LGIKKYGVNDLGEIKQKIIDVWVCPKCLYEIVITDIHGFVQICHNCGFHGDDFSHIIEKGRNNKKIGGY
jgi:uncharacterized protein (DUF2225 family)